MDNEIKAIKKVFKKLLLKNFKRVIVIHFFKFKSKKK
jgi:hypothetical protein